VHLTSSQLVKGVLLSCLIRLGAEGESAKCQEKYVFRPFQFQAKVKDGHKEAHIPASSDRSNRNGILGIVGLVAVRGRIARGPRIGECWWWVGKRKKKEEIGNDRVENIFQRV
jgi:hypothetical protein